MQDEEGPAARVEQFRCDDCGGVLLYDPAVEGLKCRHCGARASKDRLAPRTAGPREIPLRDALRSAPRGLGLAMITVQCESCGAAVSLPPEDRSHTCVYCASPMVVEGVPDDRRLQPESLIPFRVARERAVDAYQAWLAGLWLRPNDLSALASLEKVLGVYVPFWTFNTYAHSRWRAERGHNYTEVEAYEAIEEGKRVQKTRKVIKTRWEPASGERHDHHRDVLVCGSKGVSEDLADELCTFETARLLPYSPGYLCGFRAEAYAVELPDAWRRGKGKIEDTQEGRCAGDIGGDTHRGLSVDHTFSNESFKHVLLPIYVAAYRYNNRPYPVLINGQTGEVVGRAPYSFWKIFFLVVAILALVLFLRSLEQPLPPPPPAPPGVMAR